MKYFLTGTTGFIGKNLLQHLEGNEVLTYKRGQSLDALKEFKPDIIFHLAGEIYKADQMFDSNVKLTYDLLEVSKDLNYKKFIYIGSSSEYGRKSKPIKETDSLLPETMYEATKGAASLLCQGFAKTYNKPIAVARPFSVYGLHEPLRRLMPTIYHCYKYKINLNLSHAVHDWIYIDDFIDGLMALAFSEINGTVNFGTGIQTANHEVLRIFEEVLGEKIPFTPIGQIRSYDSLSWVCDTNYARESLGFECKYTLKEGVAKCTEYFAKI